MTYTLKLIDFYTHSYETTFGTCDLCMSTGTHDEEHLVFETSDNTIIDMENGYWNWGDYFTLIYVENTADFAHWLNNQEFDGEAPETEEELQKVITMIVGDYDFHCSTEEYNSIDDYITQVEFCAEINTVSKIEEDDPLLEEWEKEIFSIKGVEKTSDTTLALLSYPSEFNDNAFYSTEIDGDCFIVKGKDELLSLIIKLCELVYFNNDSVTSDFNELIVRWVENNKNKTLTLSANDIAHYYDSDYIANLMKKVK